MSESTFFVRGRNKGNERKIILSSATLLVGKAPAKTKRIKMKVRMPLNGNKPVGTPEWVMNAAEFVAKSHDVVTPQVELSGFNLSFTDDQSLFEDSKAQAQKCQLQKFVISEFGDSEDPEVQMTFTIYAPFSSALLKFCGQMAGQEFWARFDQIEDEEAEEAEDDSDQMELEEDEEEPAEV